MKRILKIVVLIISLSLVFSACAKTEDEKLYKNAAIELNGLLEQHEAISAPRRHFADEKGRVFLSVDCKGRDEFVEKNKEKLLSLASKFEEITKAYPKSKWTDDSLFCLALFAGFEPDKENGQFKGIAITALKKLANNPSFALKHWTLKTFNDSIFNSSIFKKYHAFYKEELPGVSFDEQLKAYFRLDLASELQKEGKLKEADIIFQGLLTKYSGTKFENFVRSSRRTPTFAEMTEIRREISKFRPDK